jgi:flagellar hook-length control protein FliK
VDVSTLVAGPAQAGIQSPVSKPGIGLTAGAGASGAAGESGFASLVALALDQLDGTSAAAEGAAAGTTCYAPRTDDGVERADADASTKDDELALDASVDAATISVLIALATPITAPAAVPAPELTGQGGADLVAIDGEVSGPAVTATEAAMPRAAASAPATSAPATSAPVTSAPTFADALASATNTTPAPVTPAAAASTGAAPMSDAPAALAGVPTAATPPAPATASVAPAPTPTPIPDAPAAAATPTVTPTATPTATPTPTTDAPAAAAPANPAAPTRAPRAAHPLREALAALAATTPVDAPSTAAPTPPVTSGSSGPRTAASTAAAVPETAEASPAGRDARVVTAPRVDTVAVPAAQAAGSNAGAAGEGSSDGARDAFRGATTLFRGVDGRIEIPTASVARGAALDPASAAQVPTLTGPATPADTLLRAIDAPAAARLEQALSAADPDVRNVQAMVRTVRLFTAGSGASEARLTLEPEHLGPVALTVRIDQGSVSAHFRAETPAAHRWIETHQQELRSGLREQGLEVKEVVVTTDPDGRRDGRQDPKPSRQGLKRRTPSGVDSPRFEVLV